MNTIERLEAALLAAYSIARGMRTGRSVGRTLYTVEYDAIVGLVDTPEQAALIVAAVNALPALLKVAKTTQRYLEMGAVETSRPGPDDLEEALKELEALT